MNTNLRSFGYEICVKGHLDQHWGAWFDGWIISNLEDGEALLKNTKVDQARLHSALNKIRDLNLILLSVVQIPTET